MNIPKIEDLPGFNASCKILRPAKALKRSGFATFDIETKDGLVGKELFCWAAAKRGPRGYQTIISEKPDFESLMAFLKPPKETHRKRGRGRVCYVHNLEFDSRFLMDWAVRNKIPTQPIRSHRLLALAFPTYDIVFIDSFQFTLSSQEQAERDYGVDPELTKIDCTDIFNKPFREWTVADRTRVLDHNLNDVQALHQIMSTYRQQMFEVANVDCLRAVSLPSLAMQALRKNLTDEIPNPFVRVEPKPGEKAKYKHNPALDEAIRESYRGGRTEVFQEGPAGNVDVWDVVSLYPSVIRQETFPMGTGVRTTDAKIIQQAIAGEIPVEGFVAVSYRAPKNLPYPIIGHKNEEDKLVFTLEDQVAPVVVALPELRLAAKYGYKFSPHSALLFMAGNPFRKFIDKFFQIKSDSQGAKRQVAKLILNSVYGKFGQKFTDLRANYHYGDKDFVMFERGCLKARKLPDTNIWIGIEYELQTSVRAYQNVAIASYVTSHARVRLAEALNECYWAGIPVYYCDTDSIHVPAGTDVSRVVTVGKGLGEWDLEHEYEGAYYLAPKVYAAGEKGAFRVAFKGINRLDREALIKDCQSVEEIVTLLRKPIILSERYTTLHEGMVRGNPLSSKRVTKTHKFENQKRKFNKDGSSVPWGWAGGGG